MTIVVKASNPSVDAVSARYSDSISGKFAGEALLACDTIYIKSDGLLWKADGTAATAPAAIKGLAARACAVGEAVTAWGPGTILRYADGTLTPGQTLYVGATAGLIDNAATTGDADGFAFAVNDSDIMITNLKL